jgi:hypothetical protein
MVEALNHTEFQIGVAVAISILTSKFLIEISSIINDTKSRRLRWAGQVEHMGDRRGVYRVLVGKPEGKRPLGRLKRKWEDNIKMDLQEVGCEGLEWIELAEDLDSWRALVNVVMNLRVP